MNHSLEQKQIHSLSVQQIQGVQILQMDVQELQTFISELLEENPVVDAEYPTYDKQRNAEPVSAAEWLRAHDEQNRVRTNAEQEYDAPEVAYWEKYDTGLREHLAMQLADIGLSRRELACALRIVELVDEDGYLRESDGEIAKYADATKAEIKPIIKILQTLDPPGVCARGLAECLTIQLKVKGVRGLPVKIVKHYLAELSKHQFQKIMQSAKCTEPELHEAISVITSLNPKPGSAFVNFAPTAAIFPDVIVTNVNDSLYISINDSWMPSLSINAYYLDMMANTDNSEAKKYLQERIKSAENHIRNISQRQNTIRRCAEEIVRLQRDYFLHNAPLVAMTMADVAETLGMNTSTVSRALKGKYIQTPSGVKPISALFSKKVGTRSKESISSDFAKKRITQLVFNENKRAPLSDQRISELLAIEGFKVSRRTVAKYRQELGIPAASIRQE